MATVADAQNISYHPIKPWISQKAVPFLTFAFYLFAGLLTLSVYKDWFWLTVPLILVVSHLMHGLLICFHEATHCSMRKGRLANEICSRRCPQTPSSKLACLMANDRRTCAVRYAR